MRSQEYFQRNFSHIYVERDALRYELCKDILARFQKAKSIEIDSFKQIFNRKNQDFALQKNSLKLILAVKQTGFLYPGSSVLSTYGYKHFYYNSLVLNCIYNCDYCYLQGMYNSSNIVVFVNLEDFFKATLERLSIEKPLYLSISYDTDLLAFEDLTGYCAAWVEFARKHQDLTIEIRTKSANFKALVSLKPTKNIILAWTLSPQSIIDRYEHKTPSLAARLKSAKEAILAGWQVRYCFDPVLLVDNWQKNYSALIESSFADVGDKVYDISIGSFRVNQDFLKRMQRNNPSEILHYPFERKGKVYYYPQKERINIERFFRENLAAHISEKQISIL